ncbi:MlaA family lipoprotein [Paraburkholderia unamae]|uniref:Phospholipid-binding lipoprotein MlaA n=1 Tax=Paraburkholderia unamae TaxID=219649 RepID=A0ABX5KKY4_9BURK|nr:VacJ family lipoprotein [Paraburkholderia unamae]PVX78980.1 phospholipid-binding lipoprotein MlaA [Paraburkholderia unamae]CAG9258072.1 Phospholipid-binding lipoprotein MlaA [Paraburkholderia unamae]
MKKNQAALTMAAASLALLVTSGCATGPERKPGDPFEPTNRVIFQFNDKLDTYIAQPIAKGYQKVTPQPLRQAITNFFSNLGDADNFANNLLQLKITDAVQDLMRIAMNTTFGLGGLIDFATAAGLPKHHQDFGLTMGHYGIPAGPYLVLPLFGPSSVRDGIGMGVDVKFNVINYFEPAVRNPMYLAQFVSARSDLLGATDLLKQAALDPYSFVRDAYRQQRESLIRGSQGNNAPLPDYGEPGESGGAAKPNDNGLPNYDDPDAPGGAGTTGGVAGSGASTNGLPNYDDPGDVSAAGAAPAASGAAATAAGAAGAGAGAAAAAGTAGAEAAAVAASAPATASAPVAASAAAPASGVTAEPAKPASAP